MQDILNLGSEARMNFPSKLGGNWTWRFDWEQVNKNIPLTFKGMSEIYDRPPKKEVKVDKNTPEEFLPEE